MRFPQPSFAHCKLSGKSKTTRQTTPALVSSSPRRRCRRSKAIGSEGEPRKNMECEANAKKVLALQWWALFRWKSIEGASTRHAKRQEDGTQQTRPRRFSPPQSHSHQPRFPAPTHAHTQHTKRSSPHGAHNHEPTSHKTHVQLSTSGASSSARRSRRAMRRRGSSTAPSPCPNPERKHFPQCPPHRKHVT